MTASRLVGRLIPATSAGGRAARRRKAAWHGAQIRRRYKKMMDHLTQWAAVRPTAQVVQIGSHNGSSGDPLTDLIDAHAGWRVVFVEPMVDQFSTLTQRRGNNPRFQLVRAAITDHDGEVTMTTVDVTPGMPDWANQLSSIHASTVLSHTDLVEGLANAVRTVTVPAMTFESLVAHCHVDQIDLLHLDTEGHDAAILDQIDFSRYRPEVVLFEHKHLPPEDRRRCASRLRSAGYLVHEYDSDTLAVKKPAVNSGHDVGHRWRKWFRVRGS